MEDKSPGLKVKEEIDLIELFRRIGKGLGRFINWVIRSLFYLIVFGFRKILWLFGFIVVGVLLGFALYLATDRYYSSSMIAQPNGFTSTDLYRYIDDIHTMCVKGNHAGIAALFNISDEDSKNIRNIEAFYLIDANGDGIADYADFRRQYEPTDTTLEIIQSRLFIRADVKNNDAFEEVRSGLINYINRIQYLITVNDIRQRELRDLIKQTNQEIQKLDSLQDIEYYVEPLEQRPGREGQIVFMTQKNTQLYYRDKISLLNNRHMYEKTLELSSQPITIIKDFSELQVAENPLASYLIKGALVFLILGYIVLLILAHKSELLDYLSGNKSR
jgi:hypothetical protein